MAKKVSSKKSLRSSAGSAKKRKSIKTAKKTSSKKSSRSSAISAKKRKPSKTAKKPLRKVAKKSVKKAATKSAKKTTKKSPKRSIRAKVKTPLTKPQLKRFRQMLLEKRRGLLGDMSGIESEALRKNRHGDSGDLSSLPTHPADIGTDNYEQEFTLGLLESERALLEEIDSAIERIDLKTFGICLGTVEPIALARLKARPWAKYCIDYARKLEKGLVSHNADREDVIAGLSDADLDDFEDDEE